MTTTAMMTGIFALFEEDQDRAQWIVHCSLSATVSHDDPKVPLVTATVYF
jgi:hypothetical protein